MTSFQVSPANESGVALTLPTALRDGPRQVASCEVATTRRPKNLWKADGSWALRFAALWAVTLLISSCGKKEVQPTTIEAPKAAVVSDATIEAAIADALTPSAPSKSEVQAELEAEAEDLLAKYPNKTAVELLNVPEVNESLKVALTRLGQDKGLQNKINSTVELAAKMKGLSGDPGSVGLDLDTSKYNDAKKSRMLQAVLSEDPKQIVRFLTEEIGEATPELSFGGVDRASNGVAIKEKPAPAK